MRSSLRSSHLLLMGLLASALLSVSADAEDARPDAEDARPDAEAERPAAATPAGVAALTNAIWHESPVWSGGGLGEHYVLFVDGRFLHSLSLAGCDADGEAAQTLARAGRWRVEGEGLVLEVELVWRDPKATCEYVYGDRGAFFRAVGEPEVIAAPKTLRAQLWRSDDEDLPGRVAPLPGAAVPLDSPEALEVARERGDETRGLVVDGVPFFALSEGEGWGYDAYVHSEGGHLPEAFMTFFGCVKRAPGDIICGGDGPE